MSDSAEFVLKTNEEVDKWMDTFYVGGRKAEHRLHCQWAWQEQERRKIELLEALEDLYEAYGRGVTAEEWNLEATRKAASAIAKALGK